MAKAWVPGTCWVWILFIALNFNDPSDSYEVSHFFLERECGAGCAIQRPSRGFASSSAGRLDALRRLGRVGRSWRTNRSSLHTPGWGEIDGGSETRVDIS